MSYYGNPRIDAAQFVPKHSLQVLDIGCGSGATISLLRELLPDARILGVEINEDAAKEFEGQILIGDIQAQEFRKELDCRSQSFDCILALDVLEHLVDPWEVLCYISTLLKPGGSIIVSVPNLSNLKVIAPLVLINRFKYQGAGILDRTHLRFFTKPEALALITQARLQIVAVAASGPLSLRSIASRAGLVVYAINFLTIGIFERFFAHQYIIHAIKPPSESPV